MNETEITPALSKEEWATRDVVRGEWPDRVTVSGWSTIVCVGQGDECTFPTPARHALAALCLFGQPYGFTREDARELWRVASDYEQPPRPFEADRDAAVWAKSLAARINALLPPDDELPSEARPPNG